MQRIQHDWLVVARNDQLPPLAARNGRPWHTWLILGGRGSGKTRAGAEWVRAQALAIAGLAERRAQRIALIGETIGQVRSVMIEGMSGLLSVHQPDQRPKFEASRNQLVWANGTIAQMFAADDPDSLRGPQFDAAWCDELCKWRVPDYAWDMLQFALRLGDWPQVVVTTTPRAIPLLKRIMQDDATAISRSRTARQRACAGAGLPRRDAAPLRRHADGPAGTRGRDRGRTHDRPVAARLARPGPPAGAPRADPHRGCRRSAGHLHRRLGFAAASSSPARASTTAAT